MSERDRWARLDELLDGIDQLFEVRAEWLRRESGDDEALGAEVERLLELAVSDDERISASGAIRIS